MEDLTKCVWGTKQLKFCTVRVNASLTEQFKKEWKCSATVKRGSGNLNDPKCFTEFVFPVLAEEANRIKM